MDKKLTKAVLVSLGLLCIAAMVYLTLDITSSVNDVYQLEESGNTKVINTKQNFIDEWEDLAYIERTPTPTTDPASGELTPPDTIIGNITPTDGGTADENAKIIYDVLIGLGYNPKQACAFLGNMFCESAMIPNRVQGDKHPAAASCTSNCIQVGSGKAHGIAQWDGGRRDNLLQQDWSEEGGWFTLKAQVKYFVSEITGGYYSKWVAPDRIQKNQPDGTDDLAYCTYRVYAYYEVAGAILKQVGDTKKQKTWDEAQSVDGFKDRVAQAQRYYSMFGGGK